MIIQPQEIALQNLLANLIYHPLPFASQEYLTEQGKGWCYEWKAIEVIKCLFDGEEIYTKDRCPNRMKNNPFFSKEKIIEERRLRMSLIDDLIAKRSNENCVTVYMPGRGIDIVLLQLAYSWKNIFVVEPRKEYREMLQFYFKSVPGVNDQIVYPDEIPSYPSLVFSGEVPFESAHVSRKEPFFP